MAFNSLRSAMRMSIRCAYPQRFAVSSTHWRTLCAQSEQPPRQMTVTERDANLRGQYMNLKVSSADDVTVAQARIKRLVYRSKQRGRREVDILLGNWAQTHVPTLSSCDLTDFEYLLELETTEIHDVILGSVAPPPALENS